jgi:hypothetical protein
MGDPSNVGSATVAGGQPASIRTNGPCLEGTLKSLEAGVGAKPMPASALAKVRSDGLDLLERIVTAYSTEIAAGEVGVGGAGRADETIPKRPCTGLLYGRIQSGKTVAMISLVAAAMDNGFRVIVVLTSDNVKLVQQTTERFGALDGPIAIDALSPGLWADDDKHIAKHVARSGVVFVCSKNKDRLDGLIAFLNRIGAPGFPALILDDEADQATLDTNTALRSRKRKKGEPEPDPTAIHTRVVDELRSTLRHNVFVQVTATPYALLLQTVGTALRPSFTQLLEPGAGYTGGEYFFEPEHVDGPNPPLVEVDAGESAVLTAGASEAPDGLERAIAFFLVAAGAQGIVDPVGAKQGQNFLCHTSRLRIDHRRLEGLVRTYVDRVGDDLDRRGGGAIVKLRAAYTELCKTLDAAPALDSVLEQIARRLVGRRIVVINAETDAEVGRGLNLIIGGNILGRGVTIDNLLVTYYLREPKVGQMDTMLQHARMYGYRRELMAFTRVFLPTQLSVRFHEIHCIERRLRRQLATADMNAQIVLERSATLFPTRRGVLDPDFLDAFAAEDQVFPHYPLLTMAPDDYRRTTSEIQRLVGGALSVDPQRAEISFDDLLRLVDLVPYDDKQPSQSWVPAVIIRVLEQQRERCRGRAYVFTRKMQRRTPYLTTGALSGESLKELRNLDAPVFCAFRDDGSRIAGIAGAHPFWYPTVVFDRRMPNVVVNVTDDDS